MQQLKNWVRSGQLWQLISPTIFTQNFTNYGDLFITLSLTKSCKTPEKSPQWVTPKIT
jgi:hypothetical protein